MQCTQRPGGTISDTSYSKQQRRVPHAFVAPTKTITRKEKANEKKSRIERTATPLTAQESARMRVIKEWRLEYARSQDMPAFLVFSNRTLEDLARKVPGTLAELEEMYGLGPRKIEAFGKENCWKFSLR